MDFKWEGDRYTTRFFDDTQQGCAGLELHRLADGSSQKVAKVVYWDAAGQFFLETFGFELPLSIAEKLIAEAKAELKLS